jgi:hypothetical protein
MSMLSDPISVTVDGASRSLARKSIPQGPQPSVLGNSFYSLADNSYSVATRQLLHRDGSRRSEILLGKTVTDADPNTIAAGAYNVAVGLVFLTDPYRVGVSSIPGLRTDLLALVDSALQNRLINGEH